MYILTPAFRIVFRQLSFAICIVFSELSFTIWSLCCCIGLFLGICAMVPWLPFIVVVEAKAYFERWYFGDKYFVPRVPFRPLQSVFLNCLHSLSN